MLFEILLIFLSSLEDTEVEWDVGGHVEFPLDEVWMELLLVPLTH